MCVQNFNDSRGLAIRITYRISLRSSSLWEPRHPPLKVVLDFFNTLGQHCHPKMRAMPRFLLKVLLSRLVSGFVRENGERHPEGAPEHGFQRLPPAEPTHAMYAVSIQSQQAIFTKKKILDRCGNDPSAGSPTETLLRLHLPLNDKV